MWGNDCDYERTLLDANHYHETSWYEAKKNQQDPKQGKYNHYHETSSYEAKKVQQDPKQGKYKGKYKVLNHGYLKHGGEKLQWFVVMYHHYNISMSKQLSFKGVDDSIASSIWKISKQ
jgi:hypothetical protein